MMFFLTVVGPNIFTMLQSIVPKSFIGSGTGFLNGIGNISGTLGPVLIGTILSLTGSYNLGLILIAAILITGGVSLISLSKTSFAKRVEPE